MNTSIQTKRGERADLESQNCLPKSKVHFSRVNERGQVRIPKEVCDVLKISKDTYIGFSVLDGVEGNNIVVAIEPVSDDTTIGAAWKALFRQAMNCSK